MTLRPEPTRIQDAAYSGALPSAGDLLKRFSAAAAYLVFVAVLISLVTRSSLLPTLLLLVATVALLLVMSFVLAFRLVPTGNRRRPQIRLSSLFLMVAIVAVYLNWLRWIIRGAGLQVEQLNATGWIALLGVSIFFSVIAIPALLSLSESAIWFAVWIVRWTSVRRLLRLRRSRQQRNVSVLD